METGIRMDIIPTILKFKIRNNGCFEPTVLHNFQRRLLKGELMKARQTLYEHEQKVSDRPKQNLR